MVAHIRTVAFLGLEARAVEVQVQIAKGAQAFSVVGLPDKAVSESKERVRAALFSIGLSLPFQRIVVNLAPADLPKEGSHYDLAIALGLLAAMDAIDSEMIAHYVAVGELGLDGRISRVPGVLLAALHASGLDLGLICPAAQGREASWADRAEIVAAPDLLALLNHFKGTQILPPPQAASVDDDVNCPDLCDVKGQESAKRALEVAAAGGHNLLMVGPPGVGKSFLASCLPGILPPLTPEEALETSMVASVADMIEDGRISRQRPYRTPHHNASIPALVGGGARARPGEISLAHLGVLFLDELPEFQRAALDSLRQPLETGEVTIARAALHVCYPADFQLIAAMNPCRCGYFGETGLECARAPKCAADYQSRISGPLFDRIDLHVELTPVSAADLIGAPPSESSSSVAQRVRGARAFAAARYGGTHTNARVDSRLLEQGLALDHKAQIFITKAVEKLRLSARGYHRVLRVARTLADLEETPAVTSAHLAEALSYRRQVANLKG